MAISVEKEGYREIIEATDGIKEDKESWRSILV